MFGIRWPDGTVAGFTGRARPGGGQAGPVYQEVAASGALAGALAEWWPDAQSG